MNVHELKTWPEPFKAVWDEHKTFEVRINDRDFKCGDHLILREWEPLTMDYTGRWMQVLVAYIGTFVYPGNFIGMQIDVLTKDEHWKGT